MKKNCLITKTKKVKNKIQTQTPISQIVKHFEETKRQVSLIRKDKNFNHSNVAGGIDWGSSLIRTVPVFEATFDSGVNGTIYSILTPKDTMIREAFKNQDINYKSFSIEHLSGYRYSDPKKIISELWIKIDADPVDYKASILMQHSAKEQYDLNRSRLKYKALGLKGMLFQLSPYGSPQLYCFESNYIYTDTLKTITKVCESMEKLVVINKEIWVETSKEPTPPWL